MHNSVHNPEERCSICLEEYGLLCRENGTIEVEMRLPCRHTVGSACIAIWLKTNNTCPVCRHEFFPAQPRPFLEHGIMDDEEDGQEDDEAANQSRFTDLNHQYCEQLGLDIDVCLISEALLEQLEDSPRWATGHTTYCMNAVSIYIASHLTREPRSPREIAVATGVDADHIRFTYDQLYPDRARIVDADILSLLEDSFPEANPLNFPSRGHDLTDDQIERDHVLQMLKQGCEEGCHELGLDAAVLDISDGIAARFYTAGLMAHLSPRALTAVGIFMAAHMTCCPRNARQVVEVVRMSENAFRSVYEIAYRNRDVLVDGAALEHVGIEGMERVLERLPIPSALM